MLLHVAPGFAFIAPAMVRELGRLTELHVLIEVPPKAWPSNQLGLPHPGSRLGIVDALPHLREHLPAQLARDFESAASVSYAVYPPGTGLRALGTVHTVARWVRGLHPDVVHFEGESLRSAAWCALARTPFVLGMHEIRVPYGSNYSHLAPVKWLGVFFARRLILHSQAALDELESLRPGCARKADVVPLGVMEAFPAFLAGPSDAQRRLTALFFGRLTPRKGVDRFERAAAIAAQRTANVDFWVAGMPVRGARAPAARALPNGCRLLVRAGRLQPADLAGLVATCDVVVAPYIDARQSGVVLTAYAFGKPVVATAVGGLVEQVIDEVTGLLVPVDDSEALAGAMLRVLGDTDWRANAAQAIERLVVDGGLAWSRLAPEIVCVYARAFPSRSRAPRADRDSLLKVAFVGIGYEPRRMYSDKNHMRSVIHEAVLSGRVSPYIVSVGERTSFGVDGFDEGRAEVTAPVMTMRRPVHRARDPQGADTGPHTVHGLGREYLERSLVCLAIIPVLRRLRRDHGVEVVHFFDNFGPLAGLAARAAGLPVVVSMLGRTPGKGDFVRNCLWRASFATVDAVVSSSNELASALTAVRAPVRAVAPMSATSRGHLPFQHRSLVVWTGRTQGLGAPELSLAGPAMALASSRTVGMRPEVWPKPEFAAEYGPLATAAGLPVRVWGRDFHRHMQDVRVLVSPVSDPRMIVGPPLTWVELMAAGGVVVTTPCRGLDAEDVADGRIVVADSLSTYHIASAIEKAWASEPCAIRASSRLTMADRAALHVAVWEELA